MFCIADTFTWDISYGRNSRIAPRDTRDVKPGPYAAMDQRRQACTVRCCLCRKRAFTLIIFDATTFGDVFKSAEFFDMPLE
jgi:hypothetical protein